MHSVNNNLPDTIIDLDELFATPHVIIIAVAMEVKSRRACFLLTYRCRVENKSLRELTPAVAIPTKFVDHRRRRCCCFWKHSSEKMKNSSAKESERGEREEK
jgi:hypothetical protein